MSNQISLQANKLWQLLTASSTAAIYQQALSLTWTILKETGKLLWLAFCLVLVVFDWFWNSSIRLGRKTRAWFDRFDRTDGQAASQMGQEILSAGKSSFSSLVNQARSQLGISTLPSVSGAITRTAGTEIVPISTVSPMKKYEAAGEDEPVILSGGFMASNQDSATENPSANSNEAIETNAKPEEVTVKPVSPKQKERPGEDEEVEHSPLKEPTPSSDS